MVEECIKLFAIGLVVGGGLTFFPWAIASVIKVGSDVIRKG